MEQKYLYVVFSATPYRMGRMIRLVTGEPYNHVAIALEQDLCKLYAFARRYYHTPFYGGFVTEEPYRYHHQGQTAQVRICRIPVTPAQWDALREQLEDMSARADHFLYNHLSAAAAPLHRRVIIRDAYTCAEFAVSVLRQLGYGFHSRRYYSIGAIARQLDAFRIYDGDFPAPPLGGSAFFAPKSLRHSTFVSARDIAALFLRRAKA